MYEAGTIDKEQEALAEKRLQNVNRSLQGRFRHLAKGLNFNY